MTDEHEHRYVFLRSEEEKLYYGTGRIRETRSFDVFVCETCLTYERVETDRKAWI